MNDTTNALPLPVFRLLSRHHLFNPTFFMAYNLLQGKRGIITVNDNYQTCVPHIYAAGDVIGFPALASTSMEQARTAMEG